MRLLPVICGTNDAGHTGNTEVWHIARIGNGQPLCGAVLSGRVRTARLAQSNCNSCNNCDRPWDVRDELRECLLTVYRGEPARLEDKRWKYQVSRLLDYDYVKQVFPGGDNLAITMRGKVVARDIVNPATWWDRKRRVLHARWPLTARTRCGEVIIEPFTTWTLKWLADKERERKDAIVRCLACLGARE